MGRHVGRLEDWIAGRRRETVLVAELAELPPTIRARRRTTDEHALLERAALDAIDSWRAQGRLERLGSRRYALHPRRR
jgi:hypothetical protein